MNKQNKPLPKFASEALVSFGLDKNAVAHQIHTAADSAGRVDHSFKTVINEGLSTRKRYDIESEGCGILDRSNNHLGD